MIPEEANREEWHSTQKGRNLAHLKEQQFINDMSPSRAARQGARRGEEVSPMMPSTSPATERCDISAPAFTSPLPASQTHIYQYVPYKILEKRVVIGLALRILSELR